MVPFNAYCESSHWTDLLQGIGAVGTTEQDPPDAKSLWRETVASGLELAEALASGRVTFDCTGSFFDWEHWGWMPPTEYDGSPQTGQTGRRGQALSGFGALKFL